MIYLDHNSTTIPVPGLVEKMSPFLSTSFGNPSSSSYPLGHEGKMAIEDSRIKLAELVDCEPENIIFTSGGTESIYLSFLGLIEELKIDNSKIGISAVEHSAVFKASQYIKQLISSEVIELGIKNNFILENEGLHKDIKILSCMLANNETGIFLDYKDFLSELSHDRNIEVISDPVQVIGKVPYSFSKSSSTIAFLSAHKFGGPKGIGALLIKKNSKWGPSFIGGGQEQGRRGGTEAVSQIVGLGHAASYAKKALKEGYQEEIKLLRDSFEELLISEINDIQIVGIDNIRLPNTSCFLIKNVIGSDIVRSLGEKNICISSGSACSSGLLKASKVLTSLGYSTVDAISSVRVSFGRGNTLEEIEIVIKELKNIVSSVRKNNEKKLLKLNL